MSNPENPNPNASGNTLPTSLYASLLGKLVAILDLDQGTIATVQGRQTLLQATNDFKYSLAHAKDIASRLPGGELMTSEQDAIISMLEDVRNRKRDQLLEFSSQLEAFNAADTNKQNDVQMADMDSTASTPTS